MRRLAAALALAAALSAPATALAAAGCPKTSLGAVESEVMCLECGVPLDVAEGSLQANQERTFITRQVAACRSKDQIKDALVAQYGERVLAAPKTDSGIGLAAYVIPIVAFLAAAAALAFAARRWRARRAPATSAAAAAPTLDPHEAARLEADLGRYDPL